jgi:hypothetical protein
MKHGYQTRRKKERPTHLPLEVKNVDGTVTHSLCSLVDYPGTYLVAMLPPPGVLTGAVRSELNPEFQLSLVGDPNEINKVMSSIGSGHISFGPQLFAWGDFCRTLAKIAHGYLVACIGLNGYLPFLPDLILGRSSYLSHYIGGLSGNATVTMLSSHLNLQYVPTSDGVYLVVNIHLLGAANMPTYQVVAAKVEDSSLFKVFPEGQQLGQ